MVASGASFSSSGFDRIRDAMKSIGTDVLRPSSAKGVEIAPASADVPKADALVRQGRNVFEVDRELEDRLADVFDEALQVEIDKAMNGGRGTVAAPLTKVGNEAREVVRERIDDVSPTPGGKAPLKAPRRDGSTDHIGRDTGALHAGLVVRLVGR